MSMQDTPSGERVHIGFFGRRNAGKSSVVNAVTGQDLSVVSEWKGTTTDPVRKAMELLPIGPVMIVDTPGYDDSGVLGEKRVQKTKQILNRTDIALLIVDAVEGLDAVDRELLSLFEEKEIPYFIVYNKCDLIEEASCVSKGNEVYVSALYGKGIHELKEKIAALGSRFEEKKRLVSDLIGPSDTVVLVIPIDSAAPKGRVILPQQQVLRDVLDVGGIAVCAQPAELPAVLNGLTKKPTMVITDSQAFEEVSAVVPDDIFLTSFSILMARYKGFLDVAVEGVTAIDRLKDGDKVLISEGCTHHRQCDDIGTVKLPGWLRKYTGKELVIETSSGLGFPEDLTPYALVLHCGACMLNEREVLFRMKSAADQGVPFTNYGIAIAFLHGILKRSVEIFPHLTKILE